MSGKDPSKIHRTGAYMARHIAKSLVAARIATWLEVRITYAIGMPEPLDIDAFSFGTSALPESALVDLIKQKFDLRPGSIIERFDLCRPIYSAISCYGHFGRTDVDLPWEQVHPI